jgi:Family of unknown function (DUF6186)
MIGRHVTLVVWAFLGAVVVAGQVTAVVSRGRFPGLGTHVQRLTASRVGQILLVLGWMWLGWHAFAR